VRSLREKGLDLPLKGLMLIGAEEVGVCVFEGQLRLPDLKLLAAGARWQVSKDMIIVVPIIQVEWHD
jgi:hypothetical protein